MFLWINNNICTTRDQKSWGDFTNGKLLKNIHNYQQKKSYQTQNSPLNWKYLEIFVKKIPRNPDIPRNKILNSVFLEFEFLEKRTPPVSAIRIIGVK